MIYNKGVNDMPYGWTRENEENHKVYQTWFHMLERCYSEKYHKKQPTYKNCTVCKRWLVLSSFVADYKLVDGYNQELFLAGELVLDKDIKSDGKNKEYSLKNCMFTSKSENSKQAVKTRDNSYLQGKKNPRSVKIVQLDKQKNIIKIWDSVHDIERKLGVYNSNVITCCKWYLCGENLEKWHKIYKRNPVKSCGGFIWKYYEEDDENE